MKTMEGRIMGRNTFVKHIIHLLVACVVATPAVFAASDSPTGFEMRLVRDTPGADTEDMVFANQAPSAKHPAREVLHVHKAPFIRQADVALAQVQRYRSSVQPGDVRYGPRREMVGYAISTKLTALGRERLAAATQQNIGKRIAIIVDGTILIVPEIRAAITNGESLILGDYTEQEATALAGKISAALVEK